MASNKRPLQKDPHAKMHFEYQADEGTISLQQLATRHHKWRILQWEQEFCCSQGLKSVCIAAKHALYCLMYMLPSKL